MKTVLKYVKAYALAILSPVALMLVLLLVSPETRSWAAVWNVIRQSLAPAVLGMGVLFNMKIGNWDFSIGARVVLTTILAGNFAMQITTALGLGVAGFVPVLIILSVLIGIVLGVIVGAAYYFLQIPTLIVSIGLMLIMESFTRILFNGAGTHISPGYMVLGKTPWDLILFAVAFVFASILYYKRKIGYSVRAVGSNPVVAKTNGINPKFLKAEALAVSGIFAGLYSLMSLSATGVQSAVQGTMGSAAAVFDAMMCVLIGMSIAGKGNIMFGVFAGAVVAQILKMGMMAIGLPTTFNKVVIGVFVVIFMVGSSRSDLFRKLGAKLRRKKSEISA
ncbi:MAG: hypothetical protein IJK54_04110 [Clostridia bacterium]|jgi:ribose transport system permease protein|nr:hypothetical protein [Clostridia bacterium]